MNLDRIRKKVSNGFRPFALETSGGKRHEVPHPEFIMIGMGMVAVLGRDDSATALDPLHIVAVEDPPRPGSKRDR
jgi:hypothetical protein